VLDSVIILTGGQGTRMKSKTAKVLHKLCGKAIIQWVLESVIKLKPKTIVVVVKYQAEDIKKFIKSLKISNIVFVTQSDIYGTGQAVKDALESVGNIGETLVVAGDTPLLKATTLKKMFVAHKASKAKATLLTTKIDNPTGFGRIVRQNNKIVKIVEESEATAEQKVIKEVNTSIYIFAIETLRQFINKLQNNNSKSEILLTDIILYIAKIEQVQIVMNNDKYEVLGVNDRVQLAQLSNYKYLQIAKQHMLNGVTIMDPKTTYIEADIKIGQDTVILPGCIITFPCKIGKNATIGPYSYLRPYTQLGDGGKIGGFVEIKNAKIGNLSKVPHLSYVGDAEIGDATNIGAGSIFANYDGVEKHFTKVGKNCKIGSNTVIISPKNIGDNVYTGAGTVVLSDIKNDEKVVSDNTNRRI
jgi:bifunctional UDP-N-acetylglucosamine pyrophosphorylase/glucosamine-1-phosphate N-acetyltransferase